MTTPLYDEHDPGGSHAFQAEIARKNAETARSYLEWATDPAQRRWAEGLAAVHDQQADVEQQYADALRAAAVSA